MLNVGISLGDNYHFSNLVSTIQLNNKGVLVILADKKVEAYLASKKQLLAGDDLQPLFTGSVRSNLYSVDQPISANAYNTTDTIAATQEDDRQLWHRRTAHLGFQYVEKLPDSVIGVSYQKERRSDIPTGEKACEPCLAGKMKESFVKKTDQRKTQKLRRIHADISGIKATSIRGFKYFLPVIDDATRLTHIELMKDKSAATAVPAFISTVKRSELESGEKVTLGEFGALYRANLGAIQAEYSPAYKQSLNGVAEASMWRINVFIISMLYQAGLHHTLWCYAAEHAVWLKNRLPTSALPFGDLPGTTPWEAYHGAKSSIKELRVFGCAAYSLNRSRKSSTFDARSSEELVLVGMDGSKVYKLLNPSTLKETRSVDVEFNEYRFPSIAQGFNPTEGSAQDAQRESTVVPIRDAPRSDTRYL